VVNIIGIGLLASPTVPPLSREAAMRHSSFPEYYADKKNVLRRRVSRKPTKDPPPCRRLGRDPNGPPREHKQPPRIYEVPLPTQGTGFLVTPFKDLVLLPWSSFR